MIIELSTHGSALRRKRERFLIVIKNHKTGEKIEEEIPAEKVEAIIITANAMISTQAVKLCMEKQIQLVLASWTGRPFARMWSSTPGRATEIRRKQYMNSNTNIGLEISRDIVIEKLKKQHKLLLDLRNNRRRTDNNTAVLNLDDAIATINNMKRKVIQLNINMRGFKQSLLGFEGVCASKYFMALSKCLPKKWMFLRRSQNPGLDSFNASLNYMYGMGYASVEKTIILSGLDPNAGFYHADSYGKPTLTFDIIELCRPLIDRTLMTLFNKRVVKDDWFESEMPKINDVDETHENISKFMAIRITKIGRGALLSSYKEEDLKLVEKISWQYCKKIIECLIVNANID